MTKEEIQKAEQIINDFPKWDRPMSTEESDLVEKYHEYRDMQIRSEEKYSW